MKMTLRQMMSTSLFTTIALVLLVGCGGNEEPVDKTCDEGFKWDEASMSCVQDKDCETGMEWNEETSSCQLIIPDCGEGEKLDSGSNTCVSVCEDGFGYNAETTICEKIIPDCGEGMVYREEIDMCTPLTDEEKARMSCETIEFTAAKSDASVEIVSYNPKWRYNGYSADSLTADVLHVFNNGQNGGVREAGQYDFLPADASMETCKFCVVLKKDCTQDANNVVTCKNFMSMGFGEYVIDSMELVAGNVFSGVLLKTVFQEVTIDENGKTEPVEDGEKLCMDRFRFGDSTDGGKGFVYMDRPLDAGCEYPEGPYFFLGPQQGKYDEEPGTVPPMSWPGAYINGQEVGFDLAKYRCENPNIKTLFIMLGAGWCPACSGFYGDMVCSANGILEQVHDLNAEVLFVVGDRNSPGVRADNEYANFYADKYSCDGGIRISDSDNSAGRRILYDNSMSTGIPWTAAIRMSDMKLMAVQPEKYYMDFIDIATENNTED